MAKVCIIGSGNMGTALALHLAKNNHEITIYSNDFNTVKEINQQHMNSRYLPGFRIPFNVEASNDIGEGIKNAKLIIIAVPSDAIRMIARQLHKVLNKSQIIVNVTKGLEEASLKMPSEVFAEELPKQSCRNTVFLSGPSVGSEIARGVFTAVNIASTNNDSLNITKKIMSGDDFKLLSSSDIIGVQLGGFFKNIIAIGAGMFDGLQKGTNHKAAFITLAYQEIRSLAHRVGAQHTTMSGLAGFGDLIDTCFAINSRNRRFGEALAQGKSIEAAKQDIGQVIEGLNALPMAMKLARKYKVKVKLLATLDNIINKNTEIESSLKGYLQAIDDNLS